MPIIKSKKSFNDGIVGYSENSEFVGATHIEEVGNVFKANQYDREGMNGDGFNKSRTQRHIARIPALMLAEAEKKYPGLLLDKNVLREFLKTPEGQLCLTTKKGI